LYPKFREVLEIIKKLKKDYTFSLLINTNATSDLEKHISLLKETNARLAVHLDTINKEEYIKINRTNEKIFAIVMKNIKLLKMENLLHRFNVVISKYNIAEIGRLINFACEIKVDIKAFDQLRIY